MPGRDVHQNSAFITQAIALTIGCEQFFKFRAPNAAHSGPAVIIAYADLDAERTVKEVHKADSVWVP